MNVFQKMQPVDSGGLRSLHLRPCLPHAVAVAVGVHQGRRRLSCSQDDEDDNEDDPKHDTSSDTPRVFVVAVGLRHRCHRIHRQWKQRRRRRRRPPPPPRPPPWPSPRPPHNDAPRAWPDHHPPPTPTSTSAATAASATRGFDVLSGRLELEHRQWFLEGTIVGFIIYISWRHQVSTFATTNTSSLALKPEKRTHSRLPLGLILFLLVHRDARRLDLLSSLHEAVVSRVPVLRFHEPL